LIFPEDTLVIMEIVDVFAKDVTHYGISQTPSSHLSIISTALSQKGSKNFRVIVDNESCTNVVFFEVFENDRLMSLPHSHPVKISWFKYTTIEVSITVSSPN